MRVVFGVVGLLVALAIVGLVAKQQLRAASTLRTGAMPDTAAAAGASAGGTVVETPRQVQQRIQADIGKALEQGARKDEAGQ